RRLEQIREVDGDAVEATGLAEERLHDERGAGRHALDHATHRSRGAIARDGAADVGTVAVGIVELAWPAETVEPRDAARERRVGTRGGPGIETGVSHRDHLAGALICG